MENIITFENKEYVWQYIEGKGKCLVPYKDKLVFPEYARDCKGLVLKFHNYKQHYLMCSGEKWYFMAIEGSRGTLGNFLTEGKSLEEAKEYAIVNRAKIVAQSPDEFFANKFDKS